MEHFDWTLGFWFPYINFFLFLAMAIYFLRGPLSKIAKGRRDEYLSALKIANEARDQAQSKLAEINKRLAGLDQEIAEMQSAALKDAERESARIIESAERLAKHLKEEAERIADAEVARAQQELRQTILADVRSAVESKIKAEFGPSQHAAYNAARTISLQNMSTRI